MLCRRLVERRSMVKKIALSVRNRVWLFANTRISGLIGMPNRRFVTFSANSVAGEKELRWVLVGWPTLFLLSLPAAVLRRPHESAPAGGARTHP